MGLAAVLFISFVAFFSVVPQFAGHRSLPEQELASRDLFVKNARFMHRDYIYLPPARKSVMVDSEGQAHRTADGMQMTRRDRSRKIYATSPQIQFERQSNLKESSVTPVPAAVLPQPAEFKPIEIAPIENVPQEPVIEIEREVELAHLVRGTGPLMPPVSPLSPPSAETTPPTTAPELAIRQIYRTILDQPGLPEVTRATIQVVTVQKTITLRGIVSSQEERQRFGRIASEAAGPSIPVDNQLTVSGSL